MARRTASRMAAVQAVYQMETAGEDAKTIIEEYRLHRLGKPVDGAEMVLPDGILFGRIVEGVSGRYKELEQVIGAALRKQSRYRGSSESGNGEEAARPMLPEPLLYAVLLCGACELLAHPETDAPVIISDYIDVAHGFYDGGEPKMVNAVLDTIAKAVR